MAAVKLNVFHWHLSDDQGFRVESKRYPKLQEMGSDGHYYTQDQIREVVEYARSAASASIPEFDIPGHTQAGSPAIRNWPATPGPYTIGRTWGIYDPVMDPTREAHLRVPRRLHRRDGGALPRPVLPHRRRRGESEAVERSPRASWRSRKEHNLDGRARAAGVLQPAHLEDSRRSTARSWSGWDEVLHPDLPKRRRDPVLARQRRRSPRPPSRGYRGILSWGYYLDHLQPGELSLRASIRWAGRRRSCRPTQRRASWAARPACGPSTSTPETVDSRIWPRMAAIAERFWSPKETSDVDSMYARMEAVSRMLEWTGVQHRAELRPMLDRLAGGRPAEPLRVLADASEAQGLGPRARAQKYTSLVPLNRFVDAARPESELVRAMELAATRLAGSRAAGRRSVPARAVHALGS